MPRSWRWLLFALIMIYERLSAFPLAGPLLNCDDLASYSITNSYEIRFTPSRFASSPINSLSSQSILIPTPIRITIERSTPCPLLVLNPTINPTWSPICFVHWSSPCPSSLKPLLRAPACLIAAAVYSLIVTIKAQQREESYEQQIRVMTAKLKEVSNLLIVFSLYPINRPCKRKSSINSRSEPWTSSSPR